MYYVFVKAKHAVAKDSQKSAPTFHARGNPAKSVPFVKACESVFAQNAARESQNTSRESVAKGPCKKKNSVYISNENKLLIGFEQRSTIINC